LNECGIGLGNTESNNNNNLSNNSNNNNVNIVNEVEGVNHHRALIFCQLKSMLNLVENDVLKVTKKKEILLFSFASFALLALFFFQTIIFCFSYFPFYFYFLFYFPDSSGSELLEIGWECVCE